jgi:serine/threonine protein kinase
MPSTPTHRPPQIAGHSYIRHLGSGGYADVYLYEQATPRRPVAIKVLNSSALGEQDQRRFLDEANTMAALSDHPNIVQVFSVDTTDNGQPFIAMKFYPNASLDVRVKHERFEVAEVLAIGVKIASAVETAHRSGILHRDIKPANILTSQYGEPGLTDFGIALNKGDLSSDSEGLSIPWSPPEVLVGSSTPDERADVYSLSATVWHLLTGHSPFFVAGGDNSNAALIRRICSKPVTATQRPDVPQELDRLLALAMAKEPSVRPSTALEFAKMLQDIEVSHQWSPTQILVKSEDSTYDTITSAPFEDDADENRTRLRNIQRVTPQRPASEQSTNVRAHRLPEPEASSITNSPQAPVGETIRRGATPVQQVVTPDETPPRPANRAKVLVGVALIVVLAVIGVAIFALHKSPSRAATITSTPNLQGNSSSLGTTPIGTPVVKVVGTSTSKVSISWSYGGQEKGDHYRYRINGGPWVSTATSSAIVNATQGQTICAQVQVERANGSTTSAISPEACGAPT